MSALRPTSSGRILAMLEAIGELDSTIMVIPDNGASSEGGVNGAFNEMSSFNYYWETMEDILPKMDQLGGPSSYNHYPWGWSWAGNTPFRRWKKEVYRGGSTDNLIVHWPAGITARGENRRNAAMPASAIVPTVLDVLGVEPPAAIRAWPSRPSKASASPIPSTNRTRPATITPSTSEMFGGVPSITTAGAPSAVSPQAIMPRGRTRLPLRRLDHAGDSGRSGRQRLAAST
ncbi:MAG: sulfatase-like hydrolase/transferase [Caldilineaceae bacterium]